MGFWQILLQYVQAIISICKHFINRGFGFEPLLNNEGSEDDVIKGKYWQLSFDNIKEACTLLTEGMVNKKQCQNLVSHLEVLENFKHEILEGSKDVYGNVLASVPKDLYRITLNAKALISECCKEDWPPIVILQYNNREAFRELLMDMDTWFNTMCDILQQMYPNREGEIVEMRKVTTFYPSSSDDIDEDLLALQKMIESKRKQFRKGKGLQLGSLDVVQSHEPQTSSTNHDEDVLAYYAVMERRIIELRKSSGAERYISIVPDNFPHPVHGARLSPKHPFTNVFKSKWLGMDCVTKVFSISMEASSIDSRS